MKGCKMNEWGGGEVNCMYAYCKIPVIRRISLQLGHFFLDFLVKKEVVLLLLFCLCVCFCFFLSEKIQVSLISYQVVILVNINGLLKWF